MPKLCNSAEHLSRRALIKGTLATAAGGLVMNWGGLTGASPLADTVRKAKTETIANRIIGEVSLGV